MQQKICGVSRDEDNSAKRQRLSSLACETSGHCFSGLHAGATCVGKMHSSVCSSIHASFPSRSPHTRAATVMLSTERMPETTDDVVGVRVNDLAC